MLPLQQSPQSPKILPANTQPHPGLPNSFLLLIFCNEIPPGTSGPPISHMLHPVSPHGSHITSYLPTCCNCKFPQPLCSPPPAASQPRRISPEPVPPEPGPATPIQSPNPTIQSWSPATHHSPWSQTLLPAPYLTARGSDASPPLPAHPPAAFCACASSYFPWQSPIRRIACPSTCPASRGMLGLVGPWVQRPRPS